MLEIKYAKGAEIEKDIEKYTIEVVPTHSNSEERWLLFHKSPQQIMSGDIAIYSISACGGKLSKREKGIFNGEKYADAVFGLMYKI